MTRQATDGSTLHGVNLAGWLLPDPWVTPELFAATGSLDLISLADKLGRKRYEEVMLDHLDTFITEDDFLHM